MQAPFVPISAAYGNACCSENTYFTERHSWMAQQFISTIFLVMHA